MAFPAWYAIAVGILMLGQWGFLLGTRRVPKLETDPIEIRFHIAAEFSTALALIVAGAGLLAATAWARLLYPVAIGALLYDLVNSSGYFVAQRVWPQVGLFALLLLLSVAALLVFWQVV
jgi:hypothetical protein